METKQPVDGHQLLLFSLLLIVAILAHKYYPVALLWLRPLEVQLALLALVLIPVAFMLYRGIDTVLRWQATANYETAILGASEDAVFCGNTASGEKVFIKPEQRRMHVQVIGTTNAGKTESVILPWAIQDIQQKRGLIIIDGKADRSMLNKLYAYVVAANREQDFKLFSLSNIDQSSQYNPLIGGPTEQVAERVFNAFEFDNPYYKSVQFEIFGQVLRIFECAKMVPTFLRLHQAISQPKRLRKLVGKGSPSLKSWLAEFLKLDPRERDKRTSGLTAALSHFAFGEGGVLFNTEIPGIDLGQALSLDQIIYFQLPVLHSPFLGRATGKLVLQGLQSAVADRHKFGGSPKLYSVFLDDFTEYLYPGFVSILNKTRSANIGVVFAHQALGDIKTLGEPIANSILTNSNLKIFMRGSDPESAEYFARVIGTKEAMKYTERAKQGMTGKSFTGDSSAREVEEFLFHPNRFKSSLGVGEAVMMIPHAKGAKSVHMKFQKHPDIEAKPIPTILKDLALPLPDPKPRKRKPNPKKEEEKKCAIQF